MQVNRRYLFISHLRASFTQPRESRLRSNNPAPIIAHLLLDMNSEIVLAAQKTSTASNVNDLNHRLNKTIGSSGQGKPHGLSTARSRPL